MSASDRPIVVGGEPPRLVIRFLNPLMRLLLRSPFHRLLSKQFMLLSVTGRKSGRTYTVPVVRHQSGGTIVVYDRRRGRTSRIPSGTVVVSASLKIHNCKGVH